MVNTNTSMHFKEDLADFDEFNLEQPWYNPILDPAKHPIESFSSPEEPYLIYEEDYDNTTKVAERLVRRTPLSHDNGVHDSRHGHIFQIPYMNNTYVTRGFHITVRDENGTVITNEYGPKGPIEGSPEKNGKVLWYTPQDEMHPNYIMGEENLATFVYPRPPLFRIDDYTDHEKKFFYFNRIKRTIFLPMCLRDRVIHREYMTHLMIRCPAGSQEPVADDFYEILGIEKGKDYFFEYMNVW